MRLPAAASPVPFLLLVAGLPCAAETRIQHEPPACFLAESYPRLSIVVEPADQVVRARVLFRPEAALTMPATATGAASSRAKSGDALDDSDPLGGGGGQVAGTAPSSWYAVAMTREGETLSAILPRPRMAAGKVRYVFEVTDAAAASVRDKEHVVEVVGARDACGNGKVAEAVDSAKVVVEVPPGAPLIPPVPQGFSPVGASAVEGSLALVRKGGHKGLFLALGGAALGGAAAASQLSSDPPPTRASSGPIPPGFMVVSTFPSTGGTVSVSRPFIQVAIRVVPPEPLPTGMLNARLYSSGEPALTCGTMRLNVFALDPSMAQIVRFTVLEDASACGSVDRFQVSLQDSQGRVILATGASDPDLVISMVFAP